MEQTIEHITIVYEGEYARLTPDAGFMLLNTLTDTLHSEAVVLVKEVVNFRAVPIEQEE